MSLFQLENDAYRRCSVQVFLGKSIQACTDLNWNFVSCTQDSVVYQSVINEDETVFISIFKDDSGHWLLIESEENENPAVADDWTSQFEAAFLACDGDDTLYEELYLKITEIYKKSKRRLRELSRRELQNLAMASFKNGYFFTPILLLLNSLIFVITLFTGFGFFDTEAAEAIAAGGNFGAFTLDGQPWRLLTYQFLHGGGLVHIFYNMVTLYYLGEFLEKRMGSWFFIGLYLITGCFAGLFSLLGDSMTVSTGASGAIFGLAGAGMAIIVLEKIITGKVIVPIWLAVLMLGMMMLEGLREGVDNWAHTGGLFSGFFFGTLYSLNELKLKCRKGKPVILLFASVLLLLSFSRMPLTGVNYYKLQQRFYEKVVKAYYYQQQMDTSNLKSRLKSIHDVGIKNWEKSLQISDSMFRLSWKWGLSSQQKQQSKRYFRLANSGLYSSGLYYRAWQEQTDRLNDSLILSYKNVDSLYNELFGP